MYLAVEVYWKCQGQGEQHGKIVALKPRLHVVKFVTEGLVNSRLKLGCKKACSNFACFPFCLVLVQ